MNDEAAAALASDAEQAAYFRETLIAERERILDTVISASATETAASQARRAEAEIRYIDRLIAGLDKRFPTA